MWNVRICIQLSALISIFIKHQYMVCIPHTNKRSMIYEIRRNDVGGVFVSIQTTWNGSTRAYTITTSPSTSHHKVIPESIPKSWLLQKDDTSTNEICFDLVSKNWILWRWKLSKKMLYFYLSKFLLVIALLELWMFLVISKQFKSFRQSASLIYLLSDLCEYTI